MSQLVISATRTWMHRSLMRLRHRPCTLKADITGNDIVRSSPTENSGKDTDWNGTKALKVRRCTRRRWTGNRGIIPRRFLSTIAVHSILNGKFPRIASSGNAPNYWPSFVVDVGEREKIHATLDAKAPEAVRKRKCHVEYSSYSNDVHHELLTIHNCHLTLCPSHSQDCSQTIVRVKLFAHHVSEPVQWVDFCQNLALTACRNRRVTKCNCNTKPQETSQISDFAVLILTSKGAPFRKRSLGRSWIPGGSTCQRLAVTGCASSVGVSKAVTRSFRNSIKVQYFCQKLPTTSKH